MIKSIYIDALADALEAHEIMQEFHGDNDIRQDENGFWHLTEPMEEVEVCQ